MRCYLWFAICFYSLNVCGQDAIHYKSEGMVRVVRSYVEKGIDSSGKFSPFLVQNAYDSCIYTYNEREYLDSMVCYVEGDMAKYVAYNFDKDQLVEQAIRQKYVDDENWTFRKLTFQEIGDSILKIDHSNDPIDTTYILYTDTGTVFIQGEKTLVKRYKNDVRTGLDIYQNGELAMAANFIYDEFGMLITEEIKFRGKSRLQHYEYALDTKGNWIQKFLLTEKEGKVSRRNRGLLRVYQY